MCSLEVHSSTFEWLVYIRWYVFGGSVWCSTLDLSKVKPNLLDFVSLSDMKNIDHRDIETESMHKGTTPMWMQATTHLRGYLWRLLMSFAENSKVAANANEPHCLVRCQRHSGQALCDMSI